MSQLIVVGVLLGGLVAGLLTFAPQVSEWLVRSRARRLPPALSPRMEEEWLAELDAMLSRPGQLAFAIALTLTRRHSFAIDDDGFFATSRPTGIVAAIGGSPSVVIASTVAFAAIAYGASFLMTPMYRSTARLILNSSRMAEVFEESPVRLPSANQRQRLQAQVLSQTELVRMILELKLYGVNPAGSAPVGAAVIERMRRDIDFPLLPDGQSLEIGYLSPNPRVAQQVVARLTSLYIQNGVEDRAASAESLARFLDSQIDDVRSRLLSQAAEIRTAVDVHAADVEVARLEHEQWTSTYRGLLMKRERALISANLERRQIGDSFKLVEPPRLPETPISPNRRLIAAEGAVSGFLLGVTIVLAGSGRSLRRLENALARS